MSGFIIENPDSVGDPNATPRVQLVGFHVPRHPYLPDADARSPVEAQRPCASCSLPRQNRVHDLPPTDPAVTEAEAARLGEREETE